MSGADAVLFDLDETLCTLPRSSRERLRAAFERAGLDCDPWFSPADYHDCVAELGGTGSDVRRREECFARLAAANGHDESLGVRVADAYEALTDRTETELFPGAEATLDALAEDHRLGLVTNGGPDTQSAKLDVVGLRDRFETVVLAGYETPAKPDPAPYERALADLDVPAERAAFVGNSLRTDVPGALAAGLTAVWYRYGDDPPADPSPEPDHSVDSLPELQAEPWT
jgi:HAD superfamily hydrolase (TIGR01549 family)